MRSEAWRKPLSVRPRESGDLEMLDSRFRGNERESEAAVERREASVPRHGTQGASQAPGVPRYVHASRVFRRAPERLSALRPPSIRVSEARMQTPGAENAPRERWRLFDMVNCAARAARPHPEERACRRRSANSNGRTRVSKDEDGRALMLRDASRRAWAVEVPALACGRDAPQHEGKHQPAAVRNDRRLGFPVSGLLFTGKAATATCLALQRPSRIQVPARLPTRSRSPINPPNTGSTPMPRTTLASRVRSPSQSSPW